MNTFNESVQIEETTEYQIGELMNELNQQIEVNDKVKWIGYRGDDEEVLLSATRCYQLSGSQAWDFPRG